jgi:hypothetical protein
LKRIGERGSSEMGLCERERRKTFDLTLSTSPTKPDYL